MRPTLTSQPNPSKLCILRSSGVVCRLYIKPSVPSTASKAPGIGKCSGRETQNEASKATRDTNARVPRQSKTGILIEESCGLQLMS
ncbi:hypothetical protein D3C77_525120 [compost metagenome]